MNLQDKLNKLMSDREQMIFQMGHVEGQIDIIKTLMGEEARVQEEQRSKMEPKMESENNG